MKISYNWLKKHINTGLSVSEVAKYLTDIGLEVEGVEEESSVKGGLKGVVVGQVLSCVQHPNADRLKVAKVDIAAREPLSIVCGAPNVAKGQKVAVATIGTTLYFEDKPIKIKKAKLRGELSEGMICAEDELGIGIEHNGIMVLDENLIVGSNLSECLSFENDAIFEIGLTPNRADAMSHYGVARDLHAVLNRYNIKSQLNSVKTVFKNSSNESKINIQIINKKECNRYAGVLIDGIKVNPSPKWLQNRLQSIGLSPINCVVDVGNFVMHNIGQPLHVFDANKIIGNTVIVRNAKKGEIIKTLDEEIRKLDESDLVICNKNSPMCIAGVFGGIESGVTEGTTSVFIESAYFNPVSIRKTAKRHAINSDASYRFERGVDPNFVIEGLQMAANLLCEISGGKIASRIEDEYPIKIDNLNVNFSLEKLNQLAGQIIEKKLVLAILKDLDIKVLSNKNKVLRLEIPSYRVDVRREIDVVEEVLRIYGYNNIDFPKQINSAAVFDDQPCKNKFQKKVSSYLVSNGFFEIMNNSLTSKNYLRNKANVVEVLNPLSNELNALRQSLVFGALESVSYNLNRKQDNLKMFEFGNTYFLNKNLYKEKSSLLLIATGDKNKQQWNSDSGQFTFYTIKGFVEGILNFTGITCYTIVEKQNDLYDYSIELEYKDKSISTIGKIDKSILSKFKIKQDVFVAEINWDFLFDFASTKEIEYKEVSKYPNVTRDFALLIDKSIEFEQIKTLAFTRASSMLKQVDLFDVFEGEKLPVGKKSYAVRFTFLDEEKTLTDKVVDRIMSQLQKAFESDLKAEIR